MPTPQQRIDALVAALQCVNRELINQRDCLYDSATTRDGRYTDDEDREMVEFLDALIETNAAVLALAGAEPLQCVSEAAPTDFTEAGFLAATLGEGS